MAGSRDWTLGCGISARSRRFRSIKGQSRNSSPSTESKGQTMIPYPSPRRPTPQCDARGRSSSARSAARLTPCSGVTFLAFAPTNWLNRLTAPPPPSATHPEDGRLTAPRVAPAGQALPWPASAGTVCQHQRAIGQSELFADAHACAAAELRYRGNPIVQLSMTMIGAGVVSPTAALITKRWPSGVTS